VNEIDFKPKGTPPPLQFKSAQFHKMRQNYPQILFKIYIQICWVLTNKWSPTMSSWVKFQRLKLSFFFAGSILPYFSSLFLVPTSIKTNLRNTHGIKCSHFILVRQDTTRAVMGVYGFFYSNSESRKRFSPIDEPHIHSVSRLVNTSLSKTRCG
jgi:hypothetical protein